MSCTSLRKAPKMNCGAKVLHRAGRMDITLLDPTTGLKSTFSLSVPYVALGSPALFKKSDIDVRIFYQIFNITTKKNNRKKIKLSIPKVMPKISYKSSIYLKDNLFQFFYQHK